MGYIKRFRFYRACRFIPFWECLLMPFNKMGEAEKECYDWYLRDLKEDEEFLK